MLFRFPRCLYEWWHVCAVVAVSVVLLRAFRPVPAMWLWPAVVLGGVLAVVLALHKHSFQDRLSAALKRSVISRSEAETARESERQRIAADFHDGPLQSFISFQMRLEIIRKLLERDRECGDARADAIAGPRARTGNGTARVCAWHAAGRRESEQSAIRNPGGRGTFRARQRRLGDTDVAETSPCLKRAPPREFLQIVREALNNVRKHSKASQVSIVIEAQR